jgi:uncharacterized membrane protein YbhN (UPF0104 family)
MQMALARPSPRSRYRGWWQAAVGLVVVGALAVEFGSGPFLAGIGSIDLPLVAVTAALAAGGTLCAAYRWRLVAIGLGVPVGFARAIRAYYASQLLNATLPGGVLGDLQRGLSRADRGYPLGRCLRAVAWERVLGQLVQILLTVAVLALAPSVLRPAGAVAAGCAAAVALIVLVVVRMGRRARSRRRAARTAPSSSPLDEPVSPPTPAPRTRTFGVRRATRIVAADWRGIAAVPFALPRIALCSAGVVLAHASVFVLSARSVDPQLTIGQVAPLALLVLAVGALPLNVAGWGPREGAAAWAFGLAGLGPDRGLSISVVYGVLALIGTLPGLLALLTERRDRRG